MPRGKYYPEELREEARRLRRAGLSLGEIARRLEIPKNTLTLWVRDIHLTADQRDQIKARERIGTARNRLLAAEAHRRARFARIETASRNARATLNIPHHPQFINHIAAAMLYLGEGAKADGVLAFANSNLHIIRYWLYLLRTSFDIDEHKLRLQLMYRADQDPEELQQYWFDVTGITRYIRGSMDGRTQGKPTKRAGYKGVCAVIYYDSALRRYLDALAHELMTRAGGAES